MTEKLIRTPSEELEQDDPLYRQASSTGDQEFEEPQQFVAEEANKQGQDAMRNLYRQATELEEERVQRNEMLEAEESKGDSEKLTTLLWTQLRPAYILDHLDYASFKVFFRSWLVVSICIFLLCIHKTEWWMGNGAFLIMIYSLLAVPGPWTWVFTTLVVLTCFFFHITGWAVAIVCHAISWRIRGRPTQLEILTPLIENGTCTKENITLCFGRLMLSGHYLTTKTSVIHIIGFVICYIFFSFLKGKNPANTLAFIIGTISLTVNVAFQSLVPFFDFRTIGYATLKPLGLALGLVWLSSFVIFPTTANFKYCQGIHGILNIVHNTMESEVSLLKTARLSSTQEEFSKYKEIGLARKKALRVLNLLDLHSAMVKMELSYGRFNIGDIGELRSIIKRLTNTCMGFDLFYKNVQERRDCFLAKEHSQSAVRRRRSSFIDSHGTSKIYMMLHESYKPVGLFEEGVRRKHLQDYLKNSDPDSVITREEIDSILDTINDIFSEIMSSFSEVVEALSAWLGAANEFRFYSRFFSSKKHLADQADKRELLRKASQKMDEAYAKVAPKKVEKFEQALAENERLVLILVTQGSLYGYLIDENYSALKRVVDLFSSIDNERPSPKFILPFSKSERLNPSGSMDDQTENIGEERAHMSGYELRQNVQARNPDASPPRTMLHLVGVHVLKFLRYLRKEHFWFFLKMALAGVATMIPLFCKTTTAFYFDNRLIWVTIITIFSATPYAADSMYSYVSKLVGTFFASILGFVAWYISTGNVYGVATVGIIIAVWVVMYRHFSIHINPIPGIIFSLTTYLVFGCSWVDHSYPVNTKLGVGFRVGWIRFVSVITGLTIGLIASYLPRPSTGKAAIRKLVSRALKEIGNLHCDIGKYAIQRGQDDSVHISPRNDLLENRIRDVISRLAASGPLMEVMKFEPPLTGVWPRSKYTRLIEVTGEIVTLYYALYHTFDQLKDPAFWVPFMSSKFGWTNHPFTADFFAAIYMPASALESEKPLPKLSNAHVATQHLSILKERSGVLARAMGEGFAYDEDEDDSSLSESAEDPVAPNLANIDSKLFFGPDGQLAIVGLVLIHMIYVRVDEILMTVKGLVGEEFDVDRTFFVPEFEDVEKQNLLKVEGSNSIH